MISTTTVLSEWMSLDFLDRSCPQRLVAMTMGYSSWSADEGERDSESRDLKSEGPSGSEPSLSIIAAKSLEEPIWLQPVVGPLGSLGWVAVLAVRDIFGRAEAVALPGSLTVV